MTAERFQVHNSDFLDNFQMYLHFCRFHIYIYILLFRKDISQSALRTYLFHQSRWGQYDVCLLA